MVKPVSTTLLVLLATLASAMAPLAHGTADGPGKVADWFGKFHLTKQKQTHLHFYFHDTLAGENPTAVKVAEAAMTKNSPTLFGAVYMIDDPLTAGPEPTSALVGRAQGFYASAGLESLGLLMTMNLVLMDEKNSSLSILGRNPALEAYREMPILGGTGAFRLARGVATAKTHYVNYTIGNAVVEYNVIVLHY